MEEKSGSRPIRLIVPFPLGGLTDAIGRPLAEHTKPNLGTIIIENIGGGGGSLGGERPEKGGKQMDLQWRNFLLVVTLAAAAATPAFGQAVVPTVGPAAKGEASAARVPDFSGLWVHANPGCEPLASGPTSLINLSRRPDG